MTEPARAASGAADQPSRAGDPRRWILFALMCTMLLAAMDTTVVATAIPQIVGDLGGFALFSWVFSIYLLAQTVTIPIYGKLADMFGRKNILLLGTLVFLIGSAACALAWDMHSLVLFRGLQGLGAGSIMATVATLAGDLYSVRERAAVQGWLSSVWGMAAITGPVLGGAFAQYASWRWIFLVNLPIGALALVLIATRLHEDLVPRRARIDFAGAGLLLAALALLIYSLLEGGRAWPWLSWSALLHFGGAFVLLAVLLRVERSAAEPVMPGWLWRDRTLGGANLAMIGMGIVMMAPNAYLPTLLQSVQGLGAIGAGMVLASMSLGWPTASTLSGRIYMRIGFRDTALIGAILVVLAAGGFVLMPRPQPVWLVVIDQIALGAGFGLLSTPVLVGVQSAVGWDRRGVVTGGNMFSRYLGQSLGAALFGAVFNARVGTELRAAPAALAGELPTRVDALIDALNAPGRLPAATLYIKQTIGIAIRDLFLAMTIAAVLIVIVLVVVPRHFKPDA